MRKKKSKPPRFEAMLQRARAGAFWVGLGGVMMVAATTVTNPAAWQAAVLYTLGTSLASLGIVLICNLNYVLVMRVRWMWVWRCKAIWVERGKMSDKDAWDAAEACALTWWDDKTEWEKSPWGKLPVDPLGAVICEMEYWD